VRCLLPPALSPFSFPGDPGTDPQPWLQLWERRLMDWVEGFLVPSLPLDVLGEEQVESLLWVLELSKQGWGHRQPLPPRQGPHGALG
jgi:hypothetical protein